MIEEPSTPKKHPPGAWLAFAITFFSYACLHVSRKSYSVVKSRIKDENFFWSADGERVTTDSMLATLDTLFLFFYAAGLYVAGYLGDRFNVRVVLTIGLLASGCVTAAFGGAAALGMHNIILFASVGST
jgi:sugar phosphate permease